MITLITDVNAGEPGVLTPDAIRRPLVITDLDGKPLHDIPAPPDGWSHRNLTKSIMRLSVARPSLDEEGANAFLGKDWIGSTEI